MQKGEFESVSELVLTGPHFCFETLYSALNDIFIFLNLADATCGNCTSDNSYALRTSNKITGLLMLHPE